MRKLLPVLFFVIFVTLLVSLMFTEIHGPAAGHDAVEDKIKDNYVELSFLETIASFFERLGGLFLSSNGNSGFQTDYASSAQGSETIIPYNNGKLCYLRGSKSRCLGIDLKPYQPIYGLADMDNNGVVDILYGTLNLHYASLDGGSNVDTKIPYPITPVPANVDGDPYPEFAYLDYDGKLKLTDLRGEGDARDLGIRPGLILGGMYDLDGDGRMEILYSTEEGHIAYIDTAGEKYETQIPKNGELKKFGGFGDLDMDGAVDMVYSIKEDRMQHVLIANWDGANEREAGRTPLIARDLGSVADIDNDNIPEIIYIDENGFLKYWNLANNEDGFLESEGSRISAKGLGFTYPVFIGGGPANIKPSTNFYWEPQEPKAGEPVAFKDVSSDPDGQIVEWAWNFGDGSSSQEQNPTHTYDSKGDYEVTLTVKDDGGNSASKTKKIIIEAASESPEQETPETGEGEGTEGETPKSPDQRKLIALFTYFPEYPSANEVIIFDASQSQGDIVEYMWDFGDYYVDRGTTPLTVHTYKSPGIYTISLTIKDSSGESVETLYDLAVSPSVFKVDFSFEPESPYVNEPVTFKAEHPAGYTVTKYIWDLNGDDEWDISGLEREVSYIYPLGGTYKVTLMAFAENSEGNMLVFSKTKKVQVSEKGGEVQDCYAPNLPPGDLWGMVDVERGGCVKLKPSPKVYNYLSFYHAIGGVEMTYEFRSVDAIGMPGERLASCETVSEERDWSFCITEAVGATNGVFACFRPKTATAGEPQIGAGDNEIEYYKLQRDESYSGPIPLINPILKVCYLPEEEEPPVESDITFYASCWDGSTYNEEYGKKTEAVGVALNSIIPIELITECQPEFPLPGFGEGDDTEGKIVLGLEYSSYNVVYYPPEMEELAHSVASHLEEYRPVLISITCDSPVPDKVIEAQNFLCTNYGDRLYLQLDFEASEAESLAQKLEAALSTLTGESQNPVASFTYTPTNPKVGEKITFDASASRDPDGEISEYKWEFGDGNTISDKNPIREYFYTAPKSYSVVLTVTDGDGLTDTVTKEIKVSEDVEKNSPPRASFSFSPAKPSVNEKILFDATSSSDPDGTIVEYEWDFGDGTSQSDTQPKKEHTYSSDGTYPIVLTVKDDKGATSTATKILKVVFKNIPPIANFDFDPQNPKVGEAVTFDASSSSDPDGNVLIYLWYFDDKTWGHGKVARHKFLSQGTYNVILMVTDEQGASTAVMDTVYVSP